MKIMVEFFVFFNAKRRTRPLFFPIWSEQASSIRFLFYRVSRLLLSISRETRLCPSSARKSKVQNEVFQCSRIHADQNTWNYVE